MANLVPDGRSQDRKDRSRRAGYTYIIFKRGTD